MIIFGTRGVTSTKQKGMFYCPSCSSEQPYGFKQARRYFTLYFIPVIPLDHLGSYVECEGCAGTFKEEVLSYRPDANEMQMRASFEEAIKRIMVLMMMADGEVKDAEISTIQEVLKQITGRPTTRADVEREIGAVRNQDREVLAYAGNIAPNLTDQGKEMILQAALLVLAADGEVQREEMDLAGKLGEALGMTRAHFSGVLKEFTEPA